MYILLITMAKIAADREALYQYLVRNMDDYTFDRGFGFNQEVLGYKTLDEFRLGQRQFADTRKRAELTQLFHLRDVIVPNAELMDEEYMSPHKVHGFVVDKTGKIVFLAPR